MREIATKKKPVFVQANSNSGQGHVLHYIYHYISLTSFCVVFRLSTLYLWLAGKTETKQVVNRMSKRVEGGGSWKGHESGQAVFIFLAASPLLRPAQQNRHATQAICSIEHWKSQCRKKQTRICHFYRVNIELKYPGTVSVEVLRPPNQPYVLQCTGRGRSCYERDCLEERFCFWWSFGPLIVTCCDVLLHRISTNKARQTYWQKKNVLKKKTRHTEWTKLLNYFLFGK